MSFTPTHYQHVHVVPHPVRDSTQAKVKHMTHQSPDPGSTPDNDPVRAPAPRPGEVPSPVRDVPPGQPTDPVFPPVRDPGVDPAAPAR